MTDQEFDFIRRLLHEQSALALDEDKRYLVESRLAPLARQLQLGSVAELVVRLRTRPESGLLEQLVEAMVTGETSFFRDQQPFEALRRVVLPELVKRRRDERSLNIWCAASSAGQEPYSVALLLREHFPELLNWTIRLVASDLSRAMLARARLGQYTSMEVHRGLPAALRSKYFHEQESRWQLDARVRDLVEFREINLARPWPVLPCMDLVLMRNVMIYFDVPMKKTILGRLARVLRPGGYLLLGGAETTIGLDDSYRRVERLKAGFYQLAAG